VGDARTTQEVRFQGIPVAPGIAHARVVVHWLDDEEIPFRTISASELPEEIARFEAALIATRAELLEIQQRIADAIGTIDAGVFDAYGRGPARSTVHNQTITWNMFTGGGSIAARFATTSYLRGAS
jgi:signal transduction protein with GAF and PtsI domain